MGSEMCIRDRVTECFDLATARFDVVIIDEASQSDALGLVAFALAKEVVVVGDHEQVSPYAVGMSTDRVNALIDEILTDVPNKQLYDGKTSVYDLARQSFGGTIPPTGPAPPEATEQPHR